MRILCVCLGNICRSPMAEGLFCAHVRAAGLDWQIDSAGTGGWHAGNPPDPRGVSAAAARGVDTSGQRARQVQTSDFTDFDLILAMDRSNLADLQTMRPAHATAVLAMFDPTGADVPDPYYGGPEGFDTVLDQIQAACKSRIIALKDGDPITLSPR